MKKGLGFLILIWGFSSAAWAGLLGLGLKAGVALDSENIPHLVSGASQGTLVGAAGGFFADVRLMGFLSAQTEVDFNQKGYTVHISASSSDQTQVYNYLEFPVLLKARTGLAPGLEGYLLTGPSVAVLLNETTTVVFGGNTTTVDDTRYYPGEEWSLVFGGGVEFQSFIFDIRYDLGLDSASQNVVMDRSSGQNNSLLFQLGYRLL